MTELATRTMLVVRTVESKTKKRPNLLMLSATPQPEAMLRLLDDLGLTEGAVPCVVGWSTFSREGGLQRANRRHHANVPILTASILRSNIRLQRAARISKAPSSVRTLSSSRSSSNRTSSIT